MDKIHHRHFQVHTYDADFRGTAFPTALLNFLQEAAGEHASLLGLSVTDLQKDDLTWVLSRYHVRFFRYPAIGEALEVRTWPSGQEGFFWLRDFEGRDAALQPLLSATSSWVMLNAKTRQPVRDERALGGDRIHQTRALPDDFPRLPACDSPNSELRFRVGLQDLDLNDHVNHAVYVRWALETAPQDVLRASRPVDIEVSYRAEAFYGQEILARAQPMDPVGGPAAGPTFVHSIVHGDDGQELTRLRIAWSPTSA
jgi:medium-chain acyl-[acyl-carrier-protein] hydrolase